MLFLSMNWQSWSPLQNSFIKLPVRNYCPVPEIAPENLRPANFILKPTIYGCCTWYYFGSKLSENNILEFSSKRKQEHPKISYSLIDDGWCTWGDWQSPRINIKSLSQKLARLRLKTGLWLAPFLASPKSQILIDHPDYFLKYNHKFVDGIRITNHDILFPYKKYLLNIYSPTVKKYIYNSITNAIEQWNVSLLKLDFLYAIYFDPNLKNDLLPHQFLVDLFTWIKKTYPHVYLMVCGCPFKPAKYLVDSIRISDDISIMYFWHYPWLNIIFNNIQHKLLIDKWTSLQSLSSCFNLDPDVLPDPTITSHNSPQIASLMSIFSQSKVKFYG
jgi:hypothetical protein